MPRLEFKYLIHQSKVAALEKLLAPHVMLDTYSAEHQDHCYTVRSIYYDTRNLDYYEEKLSGIRKRKKVRLRSYNDCTPASEVFFEIKRKNVMAVSKVRARVPFSKLVHTRNLYDMSDVLLENGSGNRNGAESRKFLYHIHRTYLKPSVKVIYEREAYYYKFNKGIRITLDKNLRCSPVTQIQHIFQEENLVYCLPKFYILEVKLFSNIPSWLREIIAHFGLRMQAISKYTISLDALIRRSRTFRR